MNFVTSEAYRPYFEEVASVFRDGPSMDWNFIDSIDPSDLAMSMDKDTIRQITSQFLGAVSFTVQHPTRLLRLFQILQIILKQMKDMNSKLKKALRLSLGKNEKLKEKNKKLRSITHSGVQCPVCHKVFSEMKYIDVHMFARHPEQSAVWQALRTPYYPGMTKTYDPLSTQATMQRIVDKMGDHISLELRSSELDTQMYLKKKLLKLQESMNSRVPDDTGQPAPQEVPIRDTSFVPNSFQWKPQVQFASKSTDDEDSSGEVQVTRPKPSPTPDFFLSDPDLG